MPSLDNNLLSNRHFTSPDIFNKAFNSLSFTLLFGKMHRTTHGSLSAAFTHHTPRPSDPRVRSSQENRKNGGTEKSCTSEPVQAEPQWALSPTQLQAGTAPGECSGPQTGRVDFPSARASGLSVLTHPRGNLKMDMAAPGDTRSLPPYFLGARCPQAQLLREGSGWLPPLCLRQVA